jgi:hypothetical protein
MAEAVKIEVDTRDFSRALGAYAKTVNKDMDLVVNTAAAHLAYRAVQQTHHADVNKIRSLKTATAIQVGRTTKTGKYIALRSFASLKSVSARERRTTYEASSAAFLIYLKQLRTHGKSPRSFANRAALMAGALRMVNARISSVHYVRSGWLAAAKKFKDIIQGTGGIGKTGIPKKKLGVGGASISTGGRHTAWIWNQSLYSKSEGKVSSGLMKYAREGLQKALAISQAKLEQITRERLARHAAGFGKT